MRRYSNLTNHFQRIASFEVTAHSSRFGIGFMRVIPESPEYAVRMAEYPDDLVVEGSNVHATPKSGLRNWTRARYDCSAAS